MDEAKTTPREPLPSAARAAMERLNDEAKGLHIWLRTEANAPAQRPWFRDGALDEGGRLASGRVAAGQLKALPHLWRWREIGPYLDRIAAIAKDADVPPIAFADRQQFLLTNPGLGGRLQVSSTIRCALSIYNPGDIAPVHRHTPNASRTILSAKGGYTTIEGERCVAERGDLIFTPTGTWHDHGNADAEPVIWADILDWPLLGISRLQLARRRVPGPARRQRARPGRAAEARLFAAALWHRRPDPELRSAPARLVARRHADAALSRRRDPARARRSQRRGGRSLRGASACASSIPRPAGRSSRPSIIRRSFSGPARRRGGSARPRARFIASSRVRARPRSPVSGSTGSRTISSSRRISCGAATSIRAPAAPSSTPSRTNR